MWILRIMYDTSKPWVYIGPFDSEKKAKLYAKGFGDPCPYVVWTEYLREPLRERHSGTRIQRFT